MVAYVSGPLGGKPGPADTRVPGAHARHAASERNGSGGDAAKGRIDQVHARRSENRKPEGTGKRGVRVLRDDRAPITSLAKRSGKIKFGTLANRQTKTKFSRFQARSRGAL